MSYNKNYDTSALKKHACHEHPYLFKKLKSFLATKGYKNPKWKTKVKEKENCRHFSNLRFFWQPTTLPQIRSFTIGLFGKFGFSCCKRLPTHVFYWKSMVGAFSFVIMWACTISIPPPNGDWGAPRYGGKN